MREDNGDGTISLNWNVSWVCQTNTSKNNVTLYHARTRLFLYVGVRATAGNSLFQDAIVFEKRF